MLTGFTRALLILGLIPIAACRGTSAPSGLFEGSWSGGVVEAGRGTGVVRMVLTQAGATVSGSLRTSFGGVVDRDGPVAGLVSGTSASVTYVPRDPFTCSIGTITGTLTLTLAVTGNRVTGTYSQFTCAGVTTGSVDATREKEP